MPQSRSLALNAARHDSRHDRMSAQRSTENAPLPTATAQRSRPCRTSRISRMSSIVSVATSALRRGRMTTSPSAWRPSNASLTGVGLTPRTRATVETEILEPGSNPGSERSIESRSTPDTSERRFVRSIGLKPRLQFSIFDLLCVRSNLSTQWGHVNRAVAGPDSPSREQAISRSTPQRT